ncbi:MAG: TIGR01620 family protein [Kangiellaceae bacterium]|jgi:putative membrane protein|nr:TIGR01620 family protein [Kangiellaceae bacterium]
MKPVRLDDNKVIKQTTDLTEESSVDNDKALLMIDDLSNKHKADTANTPKLFKLGSLSLLGGLVIALAVMQIVDAVMAMFGINYYLGLGSSIVLAGLVGLLAKQLVNFFGGIKKTKQREAIKTQISDLRDSESIGQVMPLLRSIKSDLPDSNQYYASFDRDKEICQSDNELVELFSQRVLVPIDDVAKQLIVKRATNLSALIALSPFSALDMMFFLWSNLKTVQEVAKIYGIPIAGVKKFRVFKQILKQMLFIGAQELALDATFDSLSVGLGSKVSARVAQGAGAGLLSLRLGIHAITYSRPIALAEDEQLKVSQLKGEVFNQLKQRLTSVKD